MTKVSVIIPVYNAETTIKRCLEAFLMQTFKDFEVICINDGSKDNSLEILNQYAKKDSRIKVFNQENSGPAKTRYNAIAKSCGEYLMFCDADDWYEPKMIEDMYSTIIEKNVDLVMCNCNVINLTDESAHSVERRKYHQLKKEGFTNITKDSLKYINVTLWNKIFKKELLEKHSILYPQKYEHDDSMFVFKYCLVANTYYGLDKFLYNYVIGNPESIMGKVFTNTNKKNTYDFIYAWQDLYDFFKITKTSRKWKTCLYQKHADCCCIYYKYLNQNQKKENFSIIQNFIQTNPELLVNKHFKAIAIAKTFEEFNKIITGEKFQKLSFWEQIFSVTNFNKYKIVRIFGFKIKIKRKNIQ